MYTPSLLNDRMMDGFLDGFFDRPTWTAVKNGTMKTDITEKDGNYHMEIELPGFSKEEIQAELKDGYLTITGTHGDTKEEKNDKGEVIFSERHTGECRRSYYVGEHLDENDIKAGFENGVLTIDFPSEEIKPLKEEKKLITIA